MWCDKEHKTEQQIFQVTISFISSLQANSEDSSLVAQTEETQKSVLTHGLNILLSRTSPLNM